MLSSVRSYNSSQSVHVISPQFGWSPLSSLLVVWPPVIFKAVDVPCVGLLHFFLIFMIVSMAFALSLSDQYVGPSVSYVMLSICLSILVCAAASSFCSRLASIWVAATYVIAGNMDELYNYHLFKITNHLMYNMLTRQSRMRCSLLAGLQVKSEGDTVECLLHHAETGFSKETSI